jgi:hypothetical protein
VQLAAEGRAEDEAHYDAEARARLLAYKRVTCTGEKWDRMLGLLELARDNLRHTECRDGDATRCPSCGLEAEIDDMLKDAR